MFAIVKEMLSPFAFITIKKNVNGRYNKFYSTDGKFYSYRAHGRYFIKHKNKLHFMFHKPENLEDALKNTMMMCDKTGFGMRVEKGGITNSYYTNYMLENMGIDHVSKYHNIRIEGTIMSKHESEIDSNSKEEMKQLRCPTYYYLPNEPKKKYPFAKGSWFNYDGTPSQDTIDNNEYYKYKKEMLDAYIEGMRLRTNRMATGRRADKKAIDAVEKAEYSGDWSNIDPADTFAIKNVSTRRKMLKHFSVQDIVNSQNPITVDEAELNNSKYKLIKFAQTIDVDAPFTHCYYLEMLNVSTGETHLEGVAPYIENNDIMWGQFAKRNTLYAETVEAALAWRDQDIVVKNDYDSGGSKNIEFEKMKKSYNQPVALS